MQPPVGDSHQMGAPLRLENFVRRQLVRTRLLRIQGVGGPAGGERRSACGSGCTANRGRPGLLEACGHARLCAGTVESSVKNPWTMKMEQFASFTTGQRQQLDELISQRQEDYSANTDILREGQCVDECHVILSGLAARYKILPDGSRQIMAFLVPGDLCDAEVFILSEMDHSVQALTPTRCAVIPAKTMRSLLREVGGLAEALWWGTMTDLAVLRERIVDHGRRDARQRLAHLLYELLIRYRMVGETDDEAFSFPVTQEELADATGMSPVHANRTLQRLRRDGLIELRDQVLKIIDPKGLKRVAQFNANYLHLMRAEQNNSDAAGRVGDLT